MDLALGFRFGWNFCFVGFGLVLLLLVLVDGLVILEFSLRTP